MTDQPTGTPTPRPLIVREEDSELESWADETQGNVRWRTLFSADRTPTNSLTCGIAELPPNTLSVASLHRHGPAEVYHILSGSGVVNVDGAETPVEAGMAVFIPSDTEHGLRNTGDSTLRLFYVFAVDSFSEVKYVFSEPPDPVEVS